LTISSLVLVVFILSLLYVSERKYSKKFWNGKENHLFFSDKGLLGKISADICDNMYLVPKTVWNADKQRECREVHVV
jgi:hypothetical protein